MNIEQISLQDLQPSPNNVRAKLKRIQELADSIAEFGLLQNLVGRDCGSHVEVVAGNRRLAALKLLAEKGSIPSDEKIPVLMMDEGADGSFEQVVENVSRSDVAIWHLGRRYNEWIDAGHTQKAIARKLGKSTAHVSTACTIARQIAPRVLAQLDKLPPSIVNHNQLMRIAKIFHPVTFEPDEKAQMKALRAIIDRGPRRKSKSALPEHKRVYQRYRRLKQGVRMPSHALPYVEAVMRFLDGTDTSLKFD